MSEQNSDDGGPAFPADPLWRLEFRGMTLLDYFAAQALAGLLANPTRTMKHVDESEQVAMWARDAYVFADAMLRERAK